MSFVSATKFYVFLLWVNTLFSIVSYNRFLNVKAVVAAFNQEKALVPSMGLFRDFRLREASFPALLATDTEPGEDDSTPSYELSPL